CFQSFSPHHFLNCYADHRTLHSFPTRRSSDLYPTAPSESRLEIVVPADSLAVLTPPDTEEIRKVAQTMRTDVLHVDDFPVISFVSTGVTPSVEGFQVQGRLTLAGQTREVSCDVRAAVGTDTLRATGEFSV